MDKNLISMRRVSITTAEGLVSALFPPIGIFSTAFRRTLDPELAALLNELTPTLIAVRMRLDAYIENTGREIGRAEFQLQLFPDQK